jgi:hypothetical protein
MSTHKRHPEWRHLVLVAGVTFGVAWAIAGARALASGPGPTERAPARVAFMAAQTPAHTSSPREARAVQSAASGAGTVLGGFTSQGWPVVIKMSGDHRRIVRVGIGLSMHCTSGSRFALNDGGGPLPIGAGRKVHMAATIPPVAGSTVSVVGGSDMISGRLEPGNTSFAGVWDLHLVFATADGHTDTCDSGRVSFTATT